MREMSLERWALWWKRFSEIAQQDICDHSRRNDGMRLLAAETEDVMKKIEEEYE
jgi:hypothetical protein